jgi:hypothetical protein
MKRANARWIGAATVLAVVACGPQMSVKSTWKDPSITGTQYKKVLVVGLSSKETVPRTFENEFSTVLSQHGVSAAPSSTTVPPGAEKDQEQMKQVLQAGGYDAVMVTRLVDRTKETTYVPGTSYTPAPYYGGFYSYYYTAYPMVYDPGYLVESEIVQIETNVYDLNTGKLVWSGISEVVDPETTTDEIRHFSHMVGDRMAKEGLIPAPAKS